jgi:hypothetical protein
VGTSVLSSASRHVQVLAQLAQCLAVVFAQTVEQVPQGWVSQRLEDRAHRFTFEAHASIMQVFTCITSTAASRII